MEIEEHSLEVIYFGNIFTYIYSNIFIWFLNYEGDLLQKNKYYNHKAHACKRKNNSP